MQQAVANFTTNNTSVSTNNGLGTYFSGLGWDQFYLPPDSGAITQGTITQVNNTDTSGNVPITIITNSSTAGLVNGAAVTITGVTEPNASEPNKNRINGNWIISNLTPTSFALVGVFQDGESITLTSAAWKAVQTTGIHVEKLAAGSDAMTLSANVGSPSLFDATKFNLESGGTVYGINTLSTGLATMGTPYITGVLAAQALQMTAGMLWSPATNGPNGTGPKLFPNYTTILSIAPDGMGAYTITMSANATATGSPGSSTTGGSFAFVGSQYSSATTPAGQPTSTPGSIPANSNVMTIDANVGMYLRPE